MEKHFYELTMPPVTVEPGKTVTVSVKVTAHIFPEYLVIPAVGSIFFQVVDILSNEKTQVKGEGFFGKKFKPLPAAVFTDENCQVALKLDSVKPGEKLTLVIKNVDPRRPHEFRSCFKVYEEKTAADATVKLELP